MSRVVQIPSEFIDFLVKNKLSIADTSDIEADPHGTSAHASTVQVGGDHYSKLGAYQPWQVLAEWMTPAELRGFAKGTAIAYLAREGDKGGDQDISKALHTLQLFEQFRKDGK